MITPNEIAGKRFDKGISGYKQEAVDNYLVTVAQQMQDLIEEKNDLEQKIEILAEKLEEYRSDEDNLRIALLSAQKLGDSVIREAKSKAEMIMRDSTLKTEKMIDNAKKQIEKEQITLLKLQKEVTTFRSKLMNLYKGHLEMINRLPSFEDPHQPKAVQEVAPQPPKEDDTVEISLSEMENMKKASLLQDEETSSMPEPVVSEDWEEEIIPENGDVLEEYQNDAEEEENQAFESSRFGPLEFGDNFQLRD